MSKLLQRFHFKVAATFKHSTFKAKCFLEYFSPSTMHNIGLLGFSRSTDFATSVGGAGIIDENFIIKSVADGSVNNKNIINSF